MSGLHESSKVGRPCLQRDQTRTAWEKTDCPISITLPCLSFFTCELGTIRRVPVRPCSAEQKFTDGGKSVSRDTNSFI